MLGPAHSTQLPCTGDVGFVDDLLAQQLGGRGGLGAFRPAEAVNHARSKNPRGWTNLRAENRLVVSAPRCNSS
jgi:hypothetical protein